MLFSKQKKKEKKKACPHLSISQEFQGHLPTQICTEAQQVTCRRSCAAAKTRDRAIEVFLSSRGVDVPFVAAEHKYDKIIQSKYDVYTYNI